MELGQLSSAEGYRLWSATYDEAGNPLIEVEQPVGDRCRLSSKSFMPKNGGSR